MTNILIVEDIIDSGNTLSHLVHSLKLKGAKSVKTCTLLDKPSRRKVAFTPDYCGKEIPDEFVVGFGLDAAHVDDTEPPLGITQWMTHVARLQASINTQTRGVLNYIGIAIRSGGIILALPCLAYEVADFLNLFIHIFIILIR